MNYKWSPEGPAFADSLYPGIKLAFSWLLRSSETYGVPEGRLNTNDEHGIMGDVGACATLPPFSLRCLYCATTRSSTARASESASI
jgi:hypothetical protein